MAILNMWVIYDHPRDYPEFYIARRWNCGMGQMKITEDILKAKMLHTLQNALYARGLAPLKRHTQDDPTIVEIWL